MSKRTFGNSYEITGIGTIGAGNTPIAAQTNEDFTGVSVYIPVTYNSGWSSISDDLVAQLQWSPDGGTTWLNFGNLTGNSTARNNNYYTSLLLTTGPSVALNNGISFSESGSSVYGFVNYEVTLPRTWRILLSIGALSSATYTIGTVQIEYL
jgi:hypothetical protein